MNTVKYKFLDQIQLPPPGHYIIAVSGGVDSVSLLHILATHQMEKGWRLAVAHFDHGIRSDSSVDAQLVRDIAGVYNLPFYSAQGNLGEVSEDQARKARYEFLQGLINELNADAIILAHHADDVRETQVFNALRGTDRAGLTALRNRKKLLRPLLNVSKSDLVEYATTLGLPWREDSTNNDVTISRNFIRKELLPIAGDNFEQELLQRSQQLAEIGKQLDSKLSNMITVSEVRGVKQATVMKKDLRKLGLAEIGEVLVAMVKSLDPATELSKKQVQALALAAKTGRVGKAQTVTAQMLMAIEPQTIVITEMAEEVQSLQAQELLPEGSIRFGFNQLSYGTSCLDASHPHVPAGLYKVRQVEAGDRIDPVGMSGTKKLQDLFVDAKIDRNRRMSWPVVASASNNQVVWVPQLALSRSISCSADASGAYCLVAEEL